MAPLWISFVSPVIVGLLGSHEIVLSQLSVRTLLKVPETFSQA